MDMCMIDVSKVKNVLPGDDVTIFGDDPSIDEIAIRMGSINYEVVCSVGKRVPRIYL
jgi:alanine racemase